MDSVAVQRSIIRRSSSTMNEPEKSTATPTNGTVTKSAFYRIRKRSNSAPAAMRRRRLIEEHYRIDPKAKTVLPGAPKHADDWARDSHDFFNLIVLVPIVVLNMMNWNWDMLLNMPKNKSISDAWTGEWGVTFIQVTMLYFIVDLAWVMLVPSCVRSPVTIIQHHIATLLYLLVPYMRPEYQWCMGACMSVEVNTWFLIARRVFNKQGFSPWIIGLPPIVSIRVKLISIFFYLTWISIRCILYPYLLMEFVGMWIRHSAKTGTRWNVVCIAIPLHASFCLLNMKWTYDLVMSKIRYWRRKGSKKDQNSKGL